MKPLQTPKLSYSILQKGLLSCGILASLLYLFANIITPIRYAGYKVASQTISELSAIDAPTRTLWISLMAVYTLLVIAFGIGVLQTTSGNRRLRVAGILIIVCAVFGYFWPPMHQREVLAAGGGTLTDTLHIVWTAITVPLMMLAVGFGGAALGKRFLFYSLLTIAVMIIAGWITGIDGPKIQTNSPTPWIGIWERIIIGVHTIWFVVFSIMLLNKKQMAASMQVKTTSMAA